MVKNDEYELLRFIEDDEEQQLHTRINRSKRPRAWSVLLALSASLNMILLVLLFTGAPRNLKSPEDILYSPASSAIEYKAVKFHRGFGHDIPLYEQPPSPDVDAAWESLYVEYLASRITRSEAKKLANKTVPLPRTDGYMAGVDVFHQLHCLDMIRKLLHPEEYPIASNPALNVTMGHVRHCIGAIRQPLMCASDVSMGVWQWSEKLQRVAARDDVLHTCRDFGKIQSWARQSDRFLPEDDFNWDDYFVKIEDDLELDQPHDRYR